MNQMTINFEPAARASDPATSHQAARNAKKFAGGHAARIHAALKLHGPMTAHELHITGLTSNSLESGGIKTWVVQADRCLPELARAGLVRVMKLDDGADVVRDGFRVWEAVCA